MAVWTAAVVIAPPVVITDGGVITCEAIVEGGDGAAMGVVTIVVCATGEVGATAGEDVTRPGVLVIAPVWTAALVVDMNGLVAIKGDDGGDIWAAAS